MLRSAALADSPAATGWLFWVSWTCRFLDPVNKRVAHHAYESFDIKRKSRIESTPRWRCHARLAHQTYHKQTFPYLEPFSQDFGAFRHDWILFGHVLKMNVGLGKDANLACFSAATATIPCTWLLEYFDDIAHVDGQAMLHLPIPVVNCCVSEGEEKKTRTNEIKGHFKQIRMSHTRHVAEKWKEQFSTFRELFVLLWAWHDQKFAADDRLSFVCLANFPPRDETEVLRRELVCISIGIDKDPSLFISNIIVHCWQLHANLIQNIQNSRSTRSEHVALTYYLNNLFMNEWIDSFTITLCAWNSRAVIMYETCSSNVMTK